MNLKQSLLNRKGRLIAFKHRLQLWVLGLGKQKNYRHYLDIQLNRTLSKRDQPASIRTRLLIDRVKELDRHFQDSRVLCIGARNPTEIQYFKSKGYTDVIGIDLFSESSDILVMDMHQMTFPDNQFNIIYSSHSLEHAYDLDKVIKEIIRVAQPKALVAIEVPIHYKTQGADLIDFQSLQNLSNCWGTQLKKVLWSEELPVGHPRNDGGNTILRAVFLLEKSSEE
jgi:SAM-dependent methyltransferase